MPLASTFSLQWYGPACGAAILTASGSVTADARGSARAGATLSGVGSVPLAKATRGVFSPATLTGTGAIISAAHKARARVSATIKVNDLSQDDISGAIRTTKIDGAMTLGEILSVCNAVLTGKVSGAVAGAPSTITFRNPTDTENRVVAVVDGAGNRTSITLTPGS